MGGRRTASRRPLPACRSGDDGRELGCLLGQQRQGFAALAGAQLGQHAALNDAKKVAMAQALYNDKKNSIADICKTLRISRSTLYRYITASR